MNWDQIAGNWTQFKDNIRQQWSKLNDDHLDFIAGSRERLIGKIRQVYGISQDQTEKQVSAWTKRMTPPANPK